MPWIPVTPLRSKRVVSALVASAGAQRVALVSDAMSAAGRPDGVYHLGSLEVTVAGGVARLGDGATIAGGTAVMADLFALLMAGRPAGRLAESAALQAAVVVTATTPARILGRDELGTLRPGSSAAFAVV